MTQPTYPEIRLSKEQILKIYDLMKALVSDTQLLAQSKGLFYEKAETHLDYNPMTKRTDTFWSFKSFHTPYGVLDLRYEHRFSDIPWITHDFEVIHVNYPSMSDRVVSYDLKQIKED